MRKILLLVLLGLPIVSWAANQEPVIILTPAKPQQQTPPPKLQMQKPVIHQQAKPVLVNLPLPERTVTQNNKTVLSHNMQLAQLQQQLSATQEDLKGYKRQLNERFVSMEQQNLTTQADILKIHQSLANLTQQLIVIGSKVANMTTLTAAPMTNSMSSSTSYLPKNKFTWWIIFGAVFLIVLLWMPSSKRETNNRQEPVVTETDPDLRDEYDFMGSQEAMPAKLNLARAYIDMEDFSSARQVLQEVITKGDIKEQLKAKQMLSVCASR